MELQEILRFADEKVFAKTGKHLDDLQEAILKETFHGRKYAKIAQDRDCTEGYVRVAAADLWNILSDVFGEEVSKVNVRSILERAIFYNYSQTIGSENVTVNNHLNICSEKARSPTENKRHQETQTQNFYIDLGDAPEISSFYGRTEELATLQNWIIHNRSNSKDCLPSRTRLVALLGISGIGKTSLALRLIDLIKTQFNYIIYRSLRFSPTLETTLTNLIKILGETSELANTTETQISQLFNLLNQHRCLIILDDVQALFSTKKLAGQYKFGYQDYQLFFQQIAQVTHPSCFILMSCEKPREIAELEQSNSPVRTLLLGSLGIAAKPLLNSHQLLDEEVWQTLIDTYQGNPLWLNITSTLIREVFSGRVSKFLDYDRLILDESLQSRLEQLLARLTEPELAVITHLSQETEAVTLAEILNKTPLSHSDLINVTKSLIRRFILETQEQESITYFTLNPVIAQSVKTQRVEII